MSKKKTNTHRKRADGKQWDQMWTLNDIVDYDSMMAQVPLDSPPVSRDASGLVALKSRAALDTVDADQVEAQQDELVSSGASSSM